jgi:uncharacterized membrane protein YfcA
LAFLYSVPIAILGGLIGLGGAEFRLPVLAGPLGYSARRAVPLNLAVSLITISAAFLIRGQILSLKAIGPLLPVIFALIVGAVAAAFYGPSLAHKLSDERLERVILILLLVIGMALIIESFLPQETAGLLPAALLWQVCAGVFFGLGIGLVSSLLGVAGGEMIIPTLVFAFGANIKTAGTASLLISFPTISVGLLRYARGGAFAERRPLTETVAPMGIGSIIGALVGGLLVGIVPVPALKLMLGVILIISAPRIFSKKHTHLMKNISL